MKTLLTLCISLMTLIVYSQNSLILKSSNGRVVYYSNAIVVSIADTVFLSDTFNFTQNIWTDTSGNDNDFDLVNSYMMNVAQPGSFIGAQMYEDDTLQLSDGVKITFACNVSSQAMVIGGTNTSNYITITNTIVRLNTDQGFEVFSVPMVGSAYDTWNEYEIEVSGSDITCTNLTTGVFETELSAVTTSLTMRFLFGRGSTTNTLEGKCAYFKIDSTTTKRNEWSFSEGYVIDDTLYSVIDRGYRQNHVKPSTDDALSYDSTNNYQHVNLQYGFSFYEDGSGNTIRFPYIGGDTATVDQFNFGPNFGLTSHSPAGNNYHNNAETALNAPIELLPYDYQNFLFTAGVANDLLFENIPENLNNQFYSDKSVENRLSNFIILNRASE